MKTNLFTVVSMCLGVLSIMTCPFFFLSFPAAGLSIIFAVLSKGSELKMEIMPKAGVITSALGMVCSFFLTVLMVLLILTSPSYRQKLNDTSVAMYGITMDEVFEQSYGVTLEDMAKQFADVIDGK